MDDDGAHIWTAGDKASPPVELGCARPIARSPAFAGPQACARCHEFDFPDSAIRAQPLAMQSTITEHRASLASERACIDCHMPEGDAHRFPGAHDPRMLRRALRVRAWRDGRRVTLDLSPGLVGHAVPTGDLFRRLEVSLLAVDAAGEERVLGRRWLGRRFAPRHQPSGLTTTDEIEDSRVGPEGLSLRFALPSELAGNLQWRVVHQRVLHAGPTPMSDVLDGSIELARGPVLDAQPSPPVSPTVD
ncbi:NapC/NirT family cytochrome c [Pseudenhygromyxa sp. WMMC2535]|uniref:NapC/NirT family cytochrome c n=1 Tax=Pseudenhygromyxa sp. WMMC2535 TaxID=2712867 RepID=UPI0020D14758|nr:NapC/NirT family cytochrome c [Pseudenhygromyxa sp. WMMC2535]